MKKEKLLITILILLVLIMLESDLFLIRALSPRNLDDVSPDIECSADLMKEADIYWVIPKYNGKKISDNKTWCNNIIKSGKEIGGGNR